MNFTYDNQGTNTFLVYEIQPTDELDSMSLGMLTNNTIPGFAAATFTQMDTTKYIRYNVTSKVPASQLFSGSVNKKRLVGVLTGIVDAIVAAEDYMLDVDSMILDMEYIFSDVSTCETELICLPVVNTGKKNPEIGTFFKNLIFTTQFDQTENCDHVAQILNFLNSNPNLSLEAFKDLLTKISKNKPSVPQPAAQQPVQQPAPQPVPQPAPQPAPQPVVQQPVQQPVVQQPAPQPVIQQPVQQPVQIPVQPKPVNPNMGKAMMPPIPGKAVPAPNQTPAPAKKEKKEEKSGFFSMFKSKKDKEAEKKEPASKAKPMPAGKPAKGGSGFAIPGQKPVPQQKAAIPVPQKSGFDAIPQKNPVHQPVIPQGNVQPIVPLQPVQEQVKIVTSSASFGETTVLGGTVGETTVLGAAVEPQKITPHLVRIKNGEEIAIDKNVFRIGKERSYVDYFVSDNTAVSRSHANIVTRDGNYFIVDTNSTNHTYVNGGMIPSNVETKLADGSKIRLANEEFEFKLR